MNCADLEHRARLWRRHLRLGDAASAFTAAVVAIALVLRFSPVAAIGLGVLTGGATWLLRRRRAPAVTAATVAAQLNRLCPALEESAGLWLRDAGSLSVVEQLQLRRLNSAWESLPARATLGRPKARAHWRSAAGCTVALALLATVGYWPAPAAGPAVPPSGQTFPAPATRRPPSQPPVVQWAEIEIIPPAYLGGAARRVAGLDATVAEGSEVVWDLVLSNPAVLLWLDGAGADQSLAAEALGGGRFRARTVLVDTRIYQLVFRQADGPRTPLPGIHALQVVRDLPPRLTWKEPATSRSHVDPSEGPARIPVALAVTDDHGVAAVELTLTVAKGSGEGVKFREKTMPLERLPGSGAGGGWFGRDLDLAALGLEPGDELYFHATAADGRAPIANRTRSETRFVVLRGPAAPLATPAATLAGLNRLPQYFRSQRQLIIDTERLLAERTQLSDIQFLARSEEIGIDQKLLRLRYGQFLGEEFEPPSSGAPREAQLMALAGGLLRQSRDDTRRAAAVERAIEAQHQHEAPPSRAAGPMTAQEIMAPYVHHHDSAEAATLFDAHVKASLRSVLAAMWEAEGLLRTGQPAAALPAENLALERLKALQQADRIYVRRIGFEPEPLKIEERRLRGELAQIPPAARSSAPSAAPDRTAAALRRALAADAAGDPALSPEETARVDAAIVTAAQAQPAIFLGALESWRHRETSRDPADSSRLRQALWALLPPADETPRRPLETQPALGRSYGAALQSGTGGAR